MKNLFFLATIILFFSACQKEQAPQINITLTTTPSDKWETAAFEISDFSFLTREDDSPSQIGGSILQQWEGAAFEQNLTIGSTNLITENEHWAMNLIGVNPYMSILLVDAQTEATEKVIIDTNNLMVELTDTYIIENNQSYMIELVIDTDAAFVEEDGRILLDWSKVTASVDTI